MKKFPWVIATVETRIQFLNEQLLGLRKLKKGLIILLILPFIC